MSVVQSLLDEIGLGSAQARNQGGLSPPYKIFRLPSKNVLGIVQKYWT